MLVAVVPSTRPFRASDCPYVEAFASLKVTLTDASPPETMNSTEPFESVVPVADDDPANEPEPETRVAFRPTFSIVFPKRSLTTAVIELPLTVAEIVRASVAVS